MDNIDLLYCNGCSFTRMASHKGFPELEDQWPHLLANKLGTEIVNDALWNGSNPRTFRKLEEFLTTFPVDTTRVFCLIQFTFTWRFEMPHSDIVTDYTWQDSPHKEDWIRLNPGHFNLENLTAILDNNNLQQTGSNSEIMSTKSLDLKWSSFGWEVINIDGHDINQIYEAYKFETKKPKLILAKTIKGKGFSFSENNNEWHHKILTKKQYEEAKKEINER